MTQPSNAITTVKEQQDQFSLMLAKADLLIKSGFLPEAIKKPEQAVAIMLYGRELNIPDWMALKHISVIHGSPNIDGQLSLALIQRSGLLEEFTILRSDTQECKIQMKRRGHTPYIAHCTFNEAGQLKTRENDKVINLTEKYNWKQQPKTMLFYFTVKQGAKRLFSDVLNGMAGRVNGALELPDSIENDTLDEVVEVRSSLVETAVRPDFWSYLTEWAFTRFELPEMVVEKALEYAEGWRKDKRVAMAAVIALHCGYDVKCAEEYTAGNGFKIETFDAAVKVIENWKAAQTSLATPEEAEVVEAEEVLQ